MVIGIVSELRNPGATTSNNVTDPTFLDNIAISISRQVVLLLIKQRKLILMAAVETRSLARGMSFLMRKDNPRHLRLKT